MRSFTTEEAYLSFISPHAGQNAHALENIWEEYHVSAYIMKLITLLCIS